MARLPRGVFKRGKSYYIRTRVGGKLVARSLGPDFTEAMRRYRLIEARGGMAQVMAEGDQLSRRQTVQAIAEQWLRGYVANRRNPKGRALAETRLRLHVLPTLAEMDARAVRPEHLRDLRLKLERGGLSLQTVAHVLADVRCMFRYAADELQAIPRSPVPPRLLPALQQRIPRPHEADEITTVLKSVEPDYGFVVRVALLTGLRWGEVRRLRWSDVDWTVSQLLITRTKSRRLRRVPIMPQLEALLRPRSGSPTAYVSPFRQAESTMFNWRVRRQSGVDAFSFHRLRHTFASNYLAAGGSLKALQTILGHSSVTVTEQYAKLDDKYVLEDARNVSKGITGGITGSNLGLLAKDREEV